jgi:hypothetical protein
MTVIHSILHGADAVAAWIIVLVSPVAYTLALALLAAFITWAVPPWRERAWSRLEPVIDVLFDAHDRRPAAEGEPQ